MFSHSNCQPYRHLLAYDKGFEIEEERALMNSNENGFYDSGYAYIHGTEQQFANKLSSLLIKTQFLMFSNVL